MNHYVLDIAGSAVLLAVAIAVISVWATSSSAGVLGIERLLARPGRTLVEAFF